MTRVVDADQREAVVAERRANVVVEASAGTGKTTLIVRRLVGMLAPRAPHAPLAIERVAVITFTRKAAGELRVRLRHALLVELASELGTTPRAKALQAALIGLDTADVVTIHAFADRLLRSLPTAAGLDPSFELIEDTSELVEETCEVLVRSAEAGQLRELLPDIPGERLVETVETLAMMQRAGLMLRTRHGLHRSYFGLDSLVWSFVTHRDRPFEEPALKELDRATLARFGAELGSRVSALSPVTRGSRWLVESGAIVCEACGLDDPAAIYERIVARLERGPLGKPSLSPRKKSEFSDDEPGWNVWKAFDGDARKVPVREQPLRDDILAPLRQWLAIRVARLRVVVLQIYEGIKTQRRVVDHVDLLLRLRDLLHTDLNVRATCQARFDHIFVDEFQDTDPLQADIVMYLCERTPRATARDDVDLAAGRLTIVGDPKQSIYRFRRADLDTYRRVVEQVRRQDCHFAQIVTSFRSRPTLVDWLNDRFDEVLGLGGGFGEVANHHLAAGREPDDAAVVHVVSLQPEPGASYDDCRALEADALGRYVRHLVERSGIRIEDPNTGEARAIGYGDVAVLALATTQLPRLVAAFDRDDVPHATRGGTLFLGDPLLRRFLLGLCALADRQDGVAMFALLQPPFFALDVRALARARDDADDPVMRARAIIADLRCERFARAPGATARALLERTGVGRMAALGPNGVQRLAALRELCFLIDRRSIEGGLDFDATIESLRSWVEAPARVDRPRPVEQDAVQVLTVHQAKGLEFPVVVLWDCRAAWHDDVRPEPFSIGASGDAWSVQLDGLTWDEPRGAPLADEERGHRSAELKRLAYVAATRARDVLVIPHMQGDDGRWMWSGVLGDGADRRATVAATHASGTPAPWYLAALPPARGARRGATSRDLDLSRALAERLREVTRDRDRPQAFTDATSTRSWWGRRGRYGTRFGQTVHLALAFCVRDGLSETEALRRAIAITALERNQAEAAQDLSRGLAALAKLGIPAPSPSARLEYPVSGRSGGSELVAGYIDLVAPLRDALLVVDFKTDQPPAIGERVPSAYRTQITGYADAIERATQQRRQVLAAFVFTADGSVHWERTFAGVPSS